MSEQLAWAAGFYCGEGSASPAQRNGRVCGIRVTIGQKDREVLDRFQQAVGVGRVNGPYGPYSGNNSCAMFFYQAGGRDATRVVRDLLWPWLSTEKREQFDRAFAALADVPEMPQRRNRAQRTAAGMDPEPPGRSPESVARYQAKSNAKVAARRKAQRLASQ
jgi:hypothetical protein